MAGDHVIDIEKLAISLTTQWNYDQLCGRSAQNETCRSLIRRINVQTRDRNKNAHEPMMLSIGPYNYHLPATHALQMTKYEFLDYILNLNHEKSLVDYLDAIKGIEKQVLICYGDEVNMDRIDFLKMLLLDGCFVLVMFCGKEALIPKLQEYSETSRECGISMPNDNTHPVINEELTSDETILQTNQSYATDDQDHQENSCSIDELYSQDLWHDILLLENQIPFFVIMKIHELMVGGSNARTSELLQNTIRTVENGLGCYPGSISKSDPPKEFFHLLHLCHMYFRPCLTEVEVHENHVKSLFHNFLPLGRNVDSSYMPSIPTRNLVAGEEPSPWRRAAEYHRAGIIFKKRDFCFENPHSLLDIAFCDGVLEIPCLMIDPNTEVLFCNLIAFEQTCAQFECYITTYVVFLSSLITMPEDVLLLTERGILVHQFNNEAEVSNLFRAISGCVVLDIGMDNYLKPLCKEIEAYYQTQRPVIRELLGSMTSSIRGFPRIYP